MFLSCPPEVESLATPLGNTVVMETTVAKGLHYLFCSVHLLPKVDITHDEGLHLRTM